MSGAPPLAPETREALRAALAALGVERLVLGILDRSIPAESDEDTGTGSPYGRGGERFLRFAHALGFDGIQLGPQGDTAEGNPSPFDATGFSRGLVALALAPLATEEWAELLPRARVDALVAARPAAPPGRVAYRAAHRAHRAALHEAFDAFVRRRGEPAVERVAARLDAFSRRHAAWLERDALYFALEEHYGGRAWPDWPDELARRLWAPRPGEEAAVARRRAELAAAHAGAMAFHRFRQLVAHGQHHAWRARARALGLRLYGDLPVGLAPADAWSARALVWDAYRMGAPPSRTNPDGQPWGYPVLDPRRPEDGQALVRARYDKLFAEYDGARIDHPHGHVDPWVYDAADPDPLRAVQRGARLYSSPNLPDHPLLAPLAIARPEQLARDPRTPRHADDWVTALDDEQVARYGARFDAIVAAARARGIPAVDVVCEVLSTLPYPLARVLARHGLGRFRVTQKADPDDPRDVYRSENAAPADWIMLGNHDTPTIWALADAWPPATRRARAAYLASRLAPEPSQRDALAARFAADARLLVQAHFADLFVGPARHVLVYFTDLFGLREPVNRPGEVSEENWTLRLVPAQLDGYAARAAAGEALHLPRAVALALRARGPDFARRHAGLLARLDP